MALLHWVAPLPGHQGPDPVDDVARGRVEAVAAAVGAVAVRGHAAEGVPAVGVKGAGLKDEDSAAGAGAGELAPHEDDAAGFDLAGGDPQAGPAVGVIADRPRHLEAVVAVADLHLAIRARGNLVDEVAVGVRGRRGQRLWPLARALGLHEHADRRPADRVARAVGQFPAHLRGFAEPDRHLFGVGFLELRRQDLATGHW